MSTLQFTLLQSPLHWEQPEVNLHMFEEKINSIAELSGIVVLPEMFTTGFSMRPSVLAEEMNGMTVAWMKRIAAQKKIILTGSLIIKEHEKYFNRLIWMQPDGNFGTYDKRHLFSYAKEDAEFTSGTKRFIAKVNGLRICTMICYDLRFPVWNRQSNENEFDVLLYVANWPVKRITAWKTLLRARAIENQCYVVALNRTGEDGNGHQYSGESCVIDPLGEILISSTEEHDNLTMVLNKQTVDEVRTMLPFQKDKDEFMLI